MNKASLSIALPQSQQLWLALSGGLDSVVLLDLVVELCQQERRGLKVLHIHHGLSPNADQWAEYCRDLCLAYSSTVEIECQVHKVQLRQKGSIEEQARLARYQVFEQSLETDDLLLMAHHGDDQAETMLLRLMRGAGSQGLSGMPKQRSLGKGSLYRPLLSYSRQQLEYYAQAQSLKWVEDESNLSLNFDRNYLRHQIVPVLKQRWSRATELFCRTSQNLSDTAELNRDLAMIDLQSVLKTDKGLYAGEVVCCQALEKLKEIRQVNLLRYWFQSQGIPELEHKQWQVIFQEVLAARIDSEPCFSWQGYEVRRFRQKLYLLTPNQIPPKDQGGALVQVIDLAKNAVRDDVVYLPLIMGRLKLEKKEALVCSGLALPDNGRLEVRYRQGGESIVLENRGRRAVKKLLQESDIPPWLRPSLPMLWWVQNDGSAQLMAVSDLWLDKVFLAKKNATGWLLSFEL